MVYSLSVSSLATAFSTFFGQNVRVSHPTPQNIDFAQKVPLWNLPIGNNTISRVCFVGHSWQLANFTMGSYKQNQLFAELRLNVCLNIHVEVLQRGLPSLDGKRFVTKNWKTVSSQTDYTKNFFNPLILKSSSINCRLDLKHF